MTSVTGYLDNLTVTETLGEGFSSIVKLAFDPVVGANYALKILNLEQTDQNTDILFKDEVAAMQCMDHKHVAKCHKFKEDATYID